MNRTENATVDRVRVMIPASERHLALLRTVAASLAGRAGHTLEGIEDLRIAVDEAGALLLESAPEHAEIEAEYLTSRSELRVELRAASESAEPPSPHSFAWTVLTALADEVEATHADGVSTIVLHKINHDTGESPS